MCKFNQLLFTNIDSATSNYTAILTCLSKNLTMVTACLINTQLSIKYGHYRNQPRPFFRGLLGFVWS